MNINDMLNFIDFIKDVDMYKKRLTALQDENARLETNIKLTAEVADIPRTKELTERLLNEARDTLKAAKTEAEEIKSKAKVVYDKRLAEVSAQETAASIALSDGRAAYKEAQDLHKTLIADLKKQQIAVEQKQAQLDASQAEVNTRLEKLKAVMG